MFGAARSGVGDGRAWDWIESAARTLRRGAELISRCVCQLLTVLTCVQATRSCGAIRSEGAAAEVEKSDHVGNSCWSAAGVIDRSRPLAESSR